MPYMELSDLKTTKTPYKGKLPTSNQISWSMVTPFVIVQLVFITKSLGRTDLPQVPIHFGQIEILQFRRRLIASGQAKRYHDKRAKTRQ